LLACAENPFMNNRNGFKERFLAGAEVFLCLAGAGAVAGILFRLLGKRQPAMLDSSVPVGKKGFPDEAIIR
jgi:hypothetical protein